MSHNGDIVDFDNKKNGGVRVCTAATKPSSPFEGQVIYVTDNSADEELEAYDGAAWQTISGEAGLWESVSSISGLKTAEDIDLQSKKLYFYKGASDALSTYIWVNASDNLEFHIADGEATEWTVG